MVEKTKGAKSLRPAMLALVAAILLAVGGVGGALLIRTESNADTSRETARFAKELRDGLVLACERNGNARAEVEREQLHEEIHEAEHPDPVAFEALVKAGVPPEAIEELEAKAIVKFEDRLRRVRIADCSAQYPTP